MVFAKNEPHYDLATSTSAQSGVIYAIASSDEKAPPVYAEVHKEKKKTNT